MLKMGIPAVIFDMDGTLADVSGIRHFLRGIKKTGKPDKNFDRFHEEGVNVPPHQWVVDALKTYKDNGFQIIIVTARMYKWRHQTAWFLGLNDIPSDALFMRTNGDQRADVIIKREIYNRIVELGYDVYRAFDDNPNIIALWDELGIPCTIVEGWED